MLKMKSQFGLVLIITANKFIKQSIYGRLHDGTKFPEDWSLYYIGLYISYNRL